MSAKAVSGTRVMGLCAAARVLLAVPVVGAGGMRFWVVRWNEVRVNKLKGASKGGGGDQTKNQYKTLFNFFFFFSSSALMSGENAGGTRVEEAVIGNKYDSYTSFRPVSTVPSPYCYSDQQQDFYCPVSRLLRSQFLLSFHTAPPPCPSCQQTSSASTANSLASASPQRPQVYTTYPHSRIDTLLGK